jgi:hypothetical protein
MSAVYRFLHTVQAATAQTYRSDSPNFEREERNNDRKS